jgi:hypothetical protein
MKKQSVTKIVERVFQAAFLFVLLIIAVYLPPLALGQRENTEIMGTDPNVDVPALDHQPAPFSPATPTPTATATPTPTATPVPIPTPTPTATPPAVCTIDGMLGAPRGGGDTGILATRIYRPGSPTSTCDGVTPPTPFNTSHGPFIYNVHYVTNATTSPLCTQISFIVLRNGTPTGRMQLSAFKAPFAAADIADSTRYLGDAGLSTGAGGQPTVFELTVPANTTIALVVVNVDLSPGGQGGSYSIGLDQALCRWGLTALGDLNGDTKPDYVLAHGTSRRTAIWYLNNNQFVSSAFGPTLFGRWRVTAVADFNNDSHSDYVIYNAETRRTGFWYLNNAVRIGTANGPTLTGDFALVGVADFDGDSKPDYLLYSPTSRATQIWYIDNAMKTGSADGPNMFTEWILAGVADFNGDSKPDYVLYNTNTRNTAIWYISLDVNTDKFVRIGNPARGPTLREGWSLVEVADFNGDSKPDYLLYNASTHQTAIWYLSFDAGTNTFVRIGSAYGPNLPP